MGAVKVTQVSICPSEAASRKGRPVLTPELLAATGARYSRNNDGLEAILSKIDPGNLEKSVESIFKMVDYGHQSIADMVPVAMFIDGVSTWLAYLVWTLCPTAGGQESSTRYLKITPDALARPEALGIPERDVTEWRALMDDCFAAYQASLALWENLAFERPGIIGIPKSLLGDPSHAAQKRVERMKRNYAFDRARYFLPAAAATNIMLVMSARGWVSLCQHLLSHPLPEPRALGGAIRLELEISAPRMTRHAKATEEWRQAIEREFQKVVRMAAEPACRVSAEPSLEVTPPPGVSEAEFAEDLKTHTNRYAPIGSALQRASARFGWSGIAFAEIRDLNRHRTGTKYCPLAPGGFYYAGDQMPGDADGSTIRGLAELGETGLSVNKAARERLRAGDPSYVYWTLMGTEFPFEHLTTADKFIYEAELRTGLGAHFRYAKHMRDALALFYARFPGTRSGILEGGAEPE
jgi:thymidylate synthase ThyX